MSIQGAHINVRRNRILRIALLFVMMGALVFAYVIYHDRPAFASDEVQTVLIFPDTVNASGGWVNTDTLRTQDLDEDALFGDFNPSNSAFISVGNTNTQNSPSGTITGTSTNAASGTTTPSVVATSTASTSTPQGFGNKSTTSTDATSTATSTVPNTGTSTPGTLQKIIDVISNIISPQTGTTSEQGGAVMQAGGGDTAGSSDATSTNTTDAGSGVGSSTPNAAPTTSTSTVSVLWGVIKHLFTTFAAAEGATSTIDTAVSTTTPEVIPSDTASTTPPVDTLPDTATSSTENTASSSPASGATSTLPVGITTEASGTSSPKVVPQTQTVPDTQGNDTGATDDTTPPVIEVLGNDPAYVAIGASYNDLGALVTDNVDDNLGIETIVDDISVRKVSIDTSTSSVHTILYRATDNAGNIGEATRTVIVGDATLDVSPEPAGSSTEEVVAKDSFCQTDNDNCLSSSVEFGDFGIASILQDRQVENLQLRFSLAARPNPGSRSDDEGFIIQYYYGGEWHNGGALPLSDEISNADNGGYFLYALPLIDDWSELSDFKVRITYESNSSLPGEVYLDSVWLEANVDSVAPAVQEDQVPVEKKDLIGQRFNVDLLSDKREFKSDELPSFRFKYRQDAGVIGNLINNLLSLLSDPYNRIEVSAKVYGTDEDLAVKYQGGGEFAVDFAKKPRSFRPGKSTLVLTIKDGANTYLATQDFFWGVLAINVDKTVYAPGEEAYIQMGAVDDLGHTVCDASLDLEIRKDGTPLTLLTTRNGSISTSDLCSGDSYVTVPDYFAHYVVPDEEGTYEMKLTGTTENGTHTITDTFEVKNQVPFDIVRTGPTRIYPPAMYPVTLTVTANEDYSGDIIEQVPQSFQVFSSDENSPTFRTHEEGDVKQLIWNVSFKAGETRTLSYRFDAPDVSPEFYLLGPLRIGSYAEPRDWQIAADAVSYVRTAGVGAGTTFSLDIGTAGTDRLVAVFADDESTGGNLTGVTVDGNNCNLVTIADNPNGIGNHQELWYCDEDDLGSSNGSVTVAIAGGGATWGVHALLFTGVIQSGPYDSGIDNTSAGINTATVNNIDSPESGLVIAGWAEGTDGLTESAQTSPLTTQTLTADPNSADLFTSYGIESSAQTNKTYQFTFSGNHNRATGIVASWDPVRTVTVSSLGNQVQYLKFATTSAYIGGAFALSLDISTTSVQSITLTENGTVNASTNLDNIELYYDLDTTAPYDCASVAFDGDETQFGSTDTDGFSGADGISTFSDSVAISSTTAMCVYPVMDVTSGASIGQTIELEISDPAGGDVSVGYGSTTPGTAVALSDTTVLSVGAPPNTPTLGDTPAFDSMQTTTTLPLFGGFAATDDDGDLVEYELIIDDDYDLSSPATTTYSYNWSGDLGWEASSTFASGATTTYQLQAADALADTTTYWWAVRARDPYNTNTWSATSTPRSLSVDTALEESRWYQTLEEQFALGSTSNTFASTSDSVEISSLGSSFDQTDDFNSLTGNNPECTVRPNYGNWTGQAGSDGADGWSADPDTTDSGGTGPASVYDGVYLYFESSASTQPCGDDATLGSSQYIESNVIDASTYALNFEFVYNMTGPAMDTGPASLHVDAWNGSSWDLDVTGSAINSGQQTSWTSSGVIDLSSYTNADFKVRIRYVMSTGGNVYENDVALDDLHIYGDPRSATGTIMSPEIDFDWVSNDNDWGLALWDVTEPTSSADTLLKVYYTNSTACDTIIPDGALPGNSTGFDASESPLFINGLSTTTYNRICLQATLSGGVGSSSPTLDDWSVSWDIPNQPPDTPLLDDTPAFDNYRATTTQPVFGGFSADDYEHDQMEYEFSIDDDYDFSSPATTTDSVNYPGDAGWDAATFAGGATTTYTLQAADALTPGVTYWWRVRARDPSGTNTWSDYTAPRSVTVDTSITVPEWYQTVEEQFAAGSTTNAVASTTDSVEIETLGGTSFDQTDDFNSLTGNNPECTVRPNYGNWTGQAGSDGADGWSADPDTTGSGGTGPASVYDGVYLYFESSASTQPCGDDATLGSTQTIESNVIDASTYALNFEFVYNMTGPAMDTGPASLHVDAWNGSSWDLDVTGSAINSGQQTSWTSSGVIDLSSYTNADFQVRIRYVMSTGGNVYENDVALDDLHIYGNTRDGATGLIMSPEIDHDWVPNQNTWGEVAFNTTEPSGSDVLMHLYYSNATSCDTIIPDGALPGNSAGFDASESPVDISGLSTTTYNRICVEGELQQGGSSVSPTLDDWTVKWVLTPQFTQSAYLWYVNEDAEPPTDFWPAGISENDLAENEPIDTTNPVGGGDILRLRMAVQATSTTASGYAFKLQYAEGSTCSAITDWSDVGAIGSSTALWRGYDNASLSDGTTVSSTTLSVSDTFETYEEENNTAAMPNSLSIGDVGEWDFVIENNGATPGTSYCFRMVDSGDNPFKTYSNYPQLVTNRTPSVTLEKLFDNEATASTSPWFEFHAYDPEGESLNYQIQIDNNYDFSSTVVDANTVDNGSAFKNLDTPSDKDPFNNNESVRFTSTTTLSDGVTYWWHVRARDPNGSDQYGDWSTAQSFTIDSGVAISTWYQTTLEQFDTDTLYNTDATTTDRVTPLSGVSMGTTTSSEIDFDWSDTANAWGQLSWNDSQPGASSITYRLEYYSNDSWALIPDADLSGNSTGLSSPVDLIDLNTETYSKIRIRADFINDDPNIPALLDWTLTWGQRVSVPTHLLPFDNEKFSTTTPRFTFYSTDPQSDDLEYQFSYSTDYTFTSSTTVDSTGNPDFTDTASSGAVSPFTSGDTIQYYMSSPLTASTTYWWRVRAKDPTGSDSWSFWSSPWSFTTATSGENVVVSTWFQDTGDQFNTDSLAYTVGSTSGSLIMQQSVDVSVLDDYTTGNTKTISSGNNRLLVVGIHAEDSGTNVDINTVTYGGQQLTEVADMQVGTGYSNNVWVGYLDEAGIAAASNDTIVPSWNGGTPDQTVFYSSIVLENVSQGDPVPVWAGSTQTNLTNPQPTTTIAVSDGDMALYFMTSGNPDLTHTPATGYSPGTNETDGGTGETTASAYKAITADGTEQPQATWDGTSNRNAMVALTVQQAPPASSGTVHSTAIDFDDGEGPTWGEMSWHDYRPGTSNIVYQLEYYTSTSSWNFIPDAALSGNSSGFTSGPIDISGLDRTTYNQIRPVATLSCDGSNNCPEINDWTVTWGPGITVSGTAQDYAHSANLTSGTVAIAVNGTLKQFRTGTISGGTWSIPYIKAFAGDSVAVFIDGATDDGKAVAVTTYGGSGDIGSMELFERHLSIGSDQNSTTTNTQLALYDLTTSGDSDLFFDVNAGNDLSATSTGPAYNDVRLYVQSGSIYEPDDTSSGNVTTHDIQIDGTFIADANTITLSGSWDNNGVFTAGSSAVILTATSTTESIDSTGASSAAFNNLTLGQTSGTAIWNNDSTLDVNGNLTLSYGTLAASTSPITLAGNLTIGASGIFTKGTGTTTFDGSVAKSWTDNTVSKQDMGKVAIDGTAKTVNLGSNVKVTDLSIGADDTLSATISNRNMEVLGNWDNHHTFTAQQGTVTFATTSPGASINPGSSAFYNLTFRGTNGTWSFTTSNVSVSNNLTVASGTPTLAVGTTTIGGSLSITDTFAHNNGTILFNGSGSKTVHASTSPFYNLLFNGSSGSFSFVDSNATSSNNVIVQNGSVTLPSGVLAVGNAYVRSGGTVSHNSGTLRMFATDATGNSITFGANNLYNLLIDGASGVFVITDSNATTSRNVTIQNGDLTLPSGTLAIGGSFTNSGTFTHNSGKVLMNAVSTGYTVDPGQSSFYDLVFQNKTGGWTLASATTTHDLRIDSADTFSTSGFIEVGGAFTNLVGGASTTWSGSTLYLNSGTNYTVNTKSLGGDAYDAFSVGPNTDIRMWNSTSTTYAVDASGSLYSQDHNTVDGSLYVFGDYERTSGTDYWDYATDFDGTSLSGGSERQANVYLASGATTTLIGGTLEIIGTSSASTTIQNQGAGQYSVVVGGTGAIDAQYYAFRDLDVNGLTITGTPTVTSLADGDFELALDSGSTMTVGGNAIDANPALQIQRVKFATTTAIGGYNVTATGTPTSYWWFRNHYGNLDGEDFDNDTGNPGDIRWDDSNNTIAISGHVYADEGGTVSSVCGGGSVVTVKVNGGGSTPPVTCDGGTGAYSIPAVSYTGDPVITVYLDTNGVERAVAVTKTPTVDITDMDLYEDRVIVRHEDVTPMTISDMAAFDSGDDPDIPFAVTLGSPDTLTLEPNTELHVWANKTFVPGGNMVLNSGGSGDAQDGTLHVGNNATLTFTGSESHSIGGSFITTISSVVDTANSTLTFTATTSGKTIAATSTLNELVFNGTGGGWTFASSTTVSGDIALDAGTVSGTADIAVSGGDVTGDGVLSLTGGTLTLSPGGAFGGGSDWTLYNLYLGDGITAATTTKVGIGTTTVLGVLTVAPNQTLDAGVSHWTLAGSGTPFLINGAFNASSTLFSYTGTGSTNVATTTYYDLALAASGGSPTYTIQTGTLDIDGALTVGDGTNAVTVTADTNDPTVTVLGDTTINQNGTFVGSSAQTLTLYGSWIDQGAYTHSNGTVLFAATTTGHTIEASSSPFFTATIDGAAGGWTITENATATNNFNLNNASSFTVSPGVTLSVGGQFANGVGGAATAWTGSTLYLNSGTNYTIDTKAIGDDSYGTLSVGPGTDIRMWNSTSTVYTIDPSGSLYSEDHNSVDGDVYIFGDYARTSGNDYWSYATDFDGTDLSGGFERQANVYLAQNATATLSAGTLSIIGTASASTTIQNQGTGTYSLAVSGGTFNASYYQIRDIDMTGLHFTGSPTVTGISHGDLLLEQNGGSMITVAGSVINANTGKTFTGDIFATSSGISSGYNVTVPDTSVGSWRFTTYGGNYGGEAYDNDPAGPSGDPGYIIWDDSNSQITISGHVYSDEGNTPLGGATCNGSNQSVQLRVAGAGSYSSACNAGTGAYSISGITFNPGDNITVYLDADNGATVRAATVTVDPLTSIANMDLYQDRVIVRHEDVNPITIDDMNICDSSSCDSDIPFDATNGSPDTLVVPAGTELHVWAGKTFTPGGNVTIHANAGGEPDGTLHVGVGGTFVASGTESHAIGGSLIMQSGATLTPANSTFAFTATTSGKIITATSSDFYNLTFNGASGGWSFPPNVVTVENDMTISSGDVTLPSATTTVGGSFTNTGGTFLHNNGLVYLTATAPGKSIEAGGSSFHDLTFNGSGGEWTFADTNATTSNNLTITVGSTTLPSGTLNIGGSFANNGGTFTALSGSTQRFSSTGTETVYGHGSAFGSLTFDGSGGDFTFIDQNATSSGSFVIENGQVSLATGTQAVADSFDNRGGTFTSGATTTVYLYGNTSGQTINANGSLFTNLTIDGTGSSGWTLTGDATTTNDLSLLYANSFTASGFIEVDGAFMNLSSNASTTWTGSTLYLNSGTNYSINTKTAGGDSYETLMLGTSATSTDIRMWNSTSTIYTTNGTSSIYSQDHNGTDGDLYIWGGYERDSGTDNWSYATDFDGTTLTGGDQRAVSVYLNGNATTTYSAATLNIVGVDGATTTIDNQGSGVYGLAVGNGSTLNAQYYQLRHMSGSGLSITGSSTTVTSLSNGDLELSENGGSLVTAASTTIDNNPTLVIDSVRLATSTGVTGYNFSRDATSTNAWTITNDYGTIAGEAFDNDGYDECGSFRFSDSACLFVNQAHYRWRNDDGGEGAPASEWYDQSFTKRKKVTITDTSGSTHTDIPVKLTVSYDSDMQTNFDDLRFTDSSGTTSIPYWIQDYVDSDSSTVWVQVPSLPASDSAFIYMYYSSSTAPDAGMGSTTFDVFDNFEDDNITEYSGDSSLFDTNSSFNYERSYGLGASAGHESSFTTTGIYRTDASSTVSQGETIRYFQYVDMTSGSDDESCMLFGVRTSPSYGNYAVCFEPYNTDHISISRDVASNDTSGTVLSSKNVTFTTGWYEVHVDWLTDDSIAVNVYKGGSFFASTTATDSNYTSGGFGFSFWGQHGGWDFVSAGEYASSDPTSSFGYEQADSGASWLADEDTAVSGVEIGDYLRLRFTVNNTGADITDQDFRLQVASKGGLSSCESVPSVSYSDVPTFSGGCGGAVACMATSTYFTDQASTTELLSVPSGSTFTYGQIVEDPSNETGDIDVLQNEFTEVEYDFNMTSSAIGDAYCFRTTNAGTALDNYAHVAEASLLHPPTITNYTLNGAQDITLTPGATTTVYATGTVIDLNGYDDLAYATATVYRTSLGAACSADDNNCYDIPSTSCSFSSCAGNSCELSCSVDMEYFADPTDVAPYESDDWTADITVYDNEAQSDTGVTLGVEVLTLRALTASSSISYGSLPVDTDTGSTNSTTTVENQGNVPIDIAVYGTDLTSGPSTIPVTDQKYATSTFTYSSCGSLCPSLSAVSTAVGVNMEKPTTTASLVTQKVFWGLYVPTGVNATTHTGMNWFSPISP